MGHCSTALGKGELKMLLTLHQMLRSSDTVYMAECHQFCLHDLSGLTAGPHTPWQMRQVYIILGFRLAQVLFTLAPVGL